MVGLVEEAPPAEAADEAFRPRKCGGIVELDEFGNGEGDEAEGPPRRWARLDSLVVVLRLSFPFMVF